MSIQVLWFNPSSANPQSKANMENTKDKKGLSTRTDRVLKAP